LNLLDTSKIPEFPKSIFIGWSEVKFDLDIAVLSDDELKTHQNFTNKQRKGEFLTARHLFWMLIQKLNLDPKTVVLKKEKTGKPFIKNDSNRLFVSFSHSQDLVLCAISVDLDIGLDAEIMNRKVNPAIIKRILSEKEWNTYGSDNPILLWTIKEASVKSLGTGLRTNLKELELTKHENGLFNIKINKKEKLQGIIFEALNHYIALAY